MTEGNIKKVDLKFVQKGRKTWTFIRDRQKTMDVEQDPLFRDLIGFANLNPDDEKDLKNKWLGFVRPRSPGPARVFNKDVKEAHSLARTGLSEMAILGEVRRRTELKINQYLEGLSEQRVFSIDDGEVAVWVAYDVPTAAAFCAYSLAAIVSAELEDSVRQCKLSECGQFFWRSLRKGPRPTYCCVEHRTTGSKRESRGQNP